MESTVRILKILEQMILLIPMTVHTNASALITRKQSLRPRMRIALRVLMGRISSSSRISSMIWDSLAWPYSRTSPYRKILRLNSNSMLSNQDFF